MTEISNKEEISANIKKGLLVSGTRYEILHTKHSFELYLYVLQEFKHRISIYVEIFSVAIT